jgi:hypothetical protein
MEALAVPLPAVVAGAAVRTTVQTLALEALGLQRLFLSSVGREELIMIRFKLAASVLLASALCLFSAPTSAQGIYAESSTIAAGVPYAFTGQSESVPADYTLAVSRPADGVPVYASLSATVAAGDRLASDGSGGFKQRGDQDEVGAEALGSGSSGGMVLVIRSARSLTGAVFKSAKLTGTGSAQSVAHNLSSTPRLVFVMIVKLPILSGITPTTLVTAHSADGTNATATVLNGADYHIVAVQ